MRRGGDVLWILTALVLIAGVIVFGVKRIGEENNLHNSEKKQTETVMALPTMIPTPAESGREAVKGRVVFTAPSISGKYELKLLAGSDSFDGEFECSPSVVKKGDEEAVSTMSAGLKTISCDDSVLSFSSDFVRWVDGERLVFDQEKIGKITVVNAVTGRTSEVDYPTEKMRFVDVNKTLKHWLFKEIRADGQVVYVLTNGDLKEMKRVDLGKQEDGYWTAKLDVVNDGFLFISEHRDEQATQIAAARGEKTGNGWYYTKFDFLNLKNLELRNLATTVPAELAGRGCTPETLASVPGEIILKDLSCILVPEDFKSRDGNVHLKL